MADPRYLSTMSLDEILNAVYMSKSAVVDGLLSSGVYILAGAPKIGKSFLVAQIALHVSKNYGTMRYIRAQSFISPWKTISAAYSRECCSRWNAESALGYQCRATLEVVGRDQPDQRLYLVKDQEHLIWNLDHVESELWKQPHDPVLESVSQIVSPENPEREGSPTALAAVLKTDMAVNRLTKHLNVNASRLLRNIRCDTE